MKIMFCIDGLKNYGGMERVAVNRANYFAENYKYDVYIVTTENKNKINKEKELSFSLNKNIKLIDLEINYEDDISSENFFIKILAKLNRRRTHKKKLQELVDKIEPDILDSLGDRSRYIIPKLRYKGKKILENHFNKNSIIRDISSEKLLKKIYFFFRNYQQYSFIDKYDEFIVLTDEDKKQWGKDKIKVIPNSLNKYPLEQSKLENKKIISVGRLDYYKGFDLMLKVIKIVCEKHQDWKLEIFGEGNMREKLESQIKELSLQTNVKLMGVTKNIQKELLSSSMFIMTSRGEGLPMVLLEAMSCGLPLVSFDCPCGPKDIIKEEENGYLCKFGDLETMAKRINYLIENKNIRLDIGKKSYEMSLMYSEKEIMKNWKNIYEKI